MVYTQENPSCGHTILSSFCGESGHKGFTMALPSDTGKVTVVACACYFPLSVWTRPSAEKPFLIMRLYHPGLFPGPGTIISLCAHFYNTKGRHGFSALAAPPVSACFLLALLNAITDQFTFKVIGEHKGVRGSKFLNEISYSCMSLYALRKAPLFSGACFLEV